ncbi:hypothetical protein GX51_03548 [Blastomyces parvus]|uniref:Uncharacterized protein n=1 Tax=Blastomyces parvus TaxID=2060905 RepID=A0A2B7X672_9EURO|nr:hypothetical protein GX51_03548 [Blastomyces parvus]
MSGVKTISLTQAHQFPITFSKLKTTEVEADMGCADLDIKIMKDDEGDLGNLWPENAIAEHENYKEIKVLLKERKQEIIAQYCAHDD